MMMSNKMGKFILEAKNIVQLKNLVLMSLTLILLSCFRGTPSEKTAIHLNPNMDDQEKYKAQAKSEFFSDGRNMRMPVEGTVARGELNEDDAFYRGKDAGGNYIKTIPLEVTHTFIKRGQQRYNIYCSPCHSLSGDGKGIVPKRGFLPPPNFHQDKVRAFDDGYIFDVISNGVRNMPDYKKQIPVKDRWAIVAYVRALQRTQNATASDIPEDKLKELK
jgi:Cytochrome C oxidase, cbb3-type, subunit III